MDLKTGRTEFTLSTGSAGFIFEVDGSYWVQGGVLDENNFYDLHTGEKVVQLEEGCDNYRVFKMNGETYVICTGITKGSTTKNVHKLNDGSIAFELPEEVYGDVDQIGGRTLARTLNCGNSSYIDMRTRQVAFKVPDQAQPWLFEVDGKIHVQGDDYKTSYQLGTVRRVDMSFDKLAALVCDPAAK